MIRLRNIALPPRPFTLQLPHDKYCAVAGRCECTAVTSVSVRELPNGRGRGVVSTIVMMPASVTIWGRGMKGEESQILHSAAAQLGPVVAAIKKHELVVVQEGAPAPPPQPESPSLQAREKPAERAVSSRKESPRLKKESRSNG